MLASDFFSSTLVQVIAGLVVLVIAALASWGVKRWIAQKNERWELINKVCTDVRDIKDVLVGASNPLTPEIKATGMINDVAVLKNQMAELVADKQPNGGGSSKDDLTALRKGQEEIKRVLNLATT